MKPVVVIRRVLTLLFIVVPLSIVAAVNGAPGEKCFFWRAQSNSATVYILGSIHMAKSDIYPLTAKIESGFANSKMLALEADPSGADQGELLVQMLSSAAYHDGETLKEHVSAETYSLAVHELEELGLTMGPFDRTRPWFLAMSIESLELLRLGFDPTLGVDIHFAKEANGKKRIVELESFDYQIRMLNGFTEKEQELFLLYTLKDLANLGRSVDGLMRAWRSGDAKALEELLTKTLRESPQLRPVYDKLLYRRNREMSGKIDLFLKGKETVFVVVGAAHLVGKEGIIQLLRDRGYSVEQM